MTASRAACLFAFAATAAAAAGMYDQPWSIVEGADESTVRKEFRPAITQIDGKSTRNTVESDPLAPGKHQVKIRFQTGRVAQSPADEERLLELELEACTRYRIAAQRTTGTNWQPKVYTEKIGECAQKFTR
ncbi:MAG TPA: hypothetical protein VFE23_18820 [Usitatibacter sp.]|jgi:hypothetical protein|nr:hypothetical protein [Usitatibacter sp.]